VKEESPLAERKSFFPSSPVVSCRKVAEGCRRSGTKFKSISTLNLLNMLDINNLRLSSLKRWDTRGREASFNGAAGVVQNGTISKEHILKHFVNPNHPVCAAAVASHLFIDGAATPPVSGGELPA
jgi:hypothetical protein